MTVSNPTKVVTFRVQSDMGGGLRIEVTFEDGRTPGEVAIEINGKMVKVPIDYVVDVFKWLKSRGWDEVPVPPAVP